ncbi:hypothetical protein OCU04_011879 [Sclerotinia nivalis]|uniref:Uncharacterized protein n=1 Tax=Sclerotinia nivalis TaxID=352851 RepID=A0A9X0A9T9_9HELO|nr:hypothetical protein OCU04_011879 [Sclerotinia nivalis]
MNLDASEIAETQRVARNFMQGIFDFLPHPFIAPQGFVDEETIMPDRQKAPRRDVNARNFYFRGPDLIPGFPFWEFRGAPRNSKDITNVPNTSYHKITQSFLDLIKRAPPEIRTHIFAQIPVKRVAEDSDINSAGHIKKSSYLMQDYTAPEAVLQFAPVKYSIRTADCADRKMSSPDYAAQSQDAKIPPKNSRFKETFEIMINVACDHAQQDRLNTSYIESDYPNSFARSYTDFVRFAASLAHSEGFYFKGSKSGWGIWKSKIRGSSLLGEFLAWFWKHFVLNFTNELEACMGWLETNNQKFICLQNISIDILATPYDVSARDLIKGSLDGRRFKRFLTELDDYTRYNQTTIEKLTLFVQIHVHDIPDLVHSPGAHRWVHALREVTFTKSFDLKLQAFKLVHKDTKEHFNAGQDPKYIAIYQKRLHQLLMPEILCYGTMDDVPDHLGLIELFAMEEK